MDERPKPAELPLDPDAEIIGVARPLHLQPEHIAAVAIGAFPGTLARYGLGRAWPVGDGSFPSSTLLVNLVGAFVLGVLLEVLVRRGDDSGWRRRVRLLAGTGFCGGFTTYSTLSIQTDLLLRRHDVESGVSYAIVSVVAGVAVAAFGIAVASADHRRRRRRLPIDPDPLAEVGR